MKITWHEDAWAEYLHWQGVDEKKLRRVDILVRDIQRGDEAGIGRPGIGKPEQLRGDLSGSLSRRVDQEHRLVYRVDDAGETVTIIACRCHHPR